MKQASVLEVSLANMIELVESGLDQKLWRYGNDMEVTRITRCPGNRYRITVREKKPKPEKKK